VNKPIAAQHKNALLRREIAEANLQTALAEKRTRIVAEYDVLKSGNSKLRRVPTAEYTNEEGVLTAYKRGQAIAMGRDLQRNYSAVATAMNQFALNAVGNGPKIRLKSKSNPEWAKYAAEWFNGDWCKRADFRDDLNFGEMVAILIMALKREGDALLVFDDFGLVPGEKPSGKVLWYEADQFVEIDDLTDNGGPWAGMKQSRGVLFDEWGRRRAYCVSSTNGVMSVPRKDATIFPAAVARHIKRVWRFNQVRGIPALLTIAADTQDLYELQSGEVQTGKTQSKIAGYVTKTKEALAALANEQGGDPDAATKDEVVYKRLEALTGGAMEYLEHDDQFNMLDWKRPALNFVESMDQMVRKSMAALGLSQTYSLLRVTSSYTAFRGEMLLAWAQFYSDQKMLERHACDWTADKAIDFGVASKELPGARPADLSMSWAWPRMPAVDPLKEAQAVELLIKTLQSNYSEQLGPEWEDRHEQLAKETERDKAMGLPTVWEAEKQGLRFGDKGTQSDNGVDSDRQKQQQTQTGDDNDEEA
jgi:capsid protein